jgi:ATP-dependent Lon protease
MSIVDIALFPIPGSVSLPFNKVPLHIFEPRYRQMIKDCVSTHRRIGVAHTQGIVSESKVSPSATQEEILKSNHSTYKAYPVFSAGFATILETLPDGRIIAEIFMDSRYEMLSEVQKIPYSIVNCRLFKDNPEELDMNLRLDLDKLLLILSGNNYKSLENLFSQSEWRNISLFEYSFRVYSLIGIEPDVLQKVLELRSTNDRIYFLKELLTPRTLD